MTFPNSFEIAKEHGIEVVFGESTLREAHPNTAQILLTSVTGKKLEIVGESLGGSRINIAQIDGITTNFSGDYPTLVVHNMDQPGHVAEVTSMLAHKSVNTGPTGAVILLWCLNVTRKYQMTELTG